MGRWRSPVPYSQVITDHQAGERVAGADVVADGAGGFATGSKSGAYDYVIPRPVVTPAVNTQGAKAATTGMNAGGFEPKSKSLRLGSRTRGL